MLAGSAVVWANGPEGRKSKRSPATALPKCLVIFPKPSPFQPQKRKIPFLTTKPHAYTATGIGLQDAQIGRLYNKNPTLQAQSTAPANGHKGFLLKSQTRICHCEEF